ncbi:MAG: DNA repair protein RecO [Proteobacteria bacterium]|nr:DNA repair protein RecO [Pseudomonadota bacterium]
MLSNIKDEGIILKVENFREYDKKLIIFLANNGVISVVAFGAKRSKRRFGGNLDPFNISFFEIQENRNGYYLKEVSVRNIFSEIKKNIQTINILLNISMLLTKTSMNISKNIYRALYKLLFKLEEHVNSDFFKYYIFFLLYFLKKEGLLAPFKCFSCDNRNIKFMMIKELIYFLCQKCEDDNSIPLMDEEAEFVRICIEGSKGFEKTNYDNSIYKQIEKKLLLYIIDNFRIPLKEI